MQVSEFGNLSSVKRLGRIELGKADRLASERKPCESKQSCKHF